MYIFHIYLYKTYLDRYIKLLWMAFSGELGELLFGGLNNSEHFAQPLSMYKKSPHPKHTKKHKV